MKNFSLYSILFILFFTSKNNFAQKNKEGKFVLNGFVYGYSSETIKKIFKKDIQFKHEGKLQDVTINIKQNQDNIFSSKTNNNGEFELKLSYGKTYTIEFEKSNYKKLLIEIDLSLVPQEVFLKSLNFKDVQISLNTTSENVEDEKNTPIAKLFFNNKLNYIDFEVLSKNKKGIFSKDNPYNVIQHLKNAVEINKEQTILIVKNSIESKQSTSQTSEANISKSTITKTANEDIKNLKVSDIKQREIEIAFALKQLEVEKLKAVTPEEIAIIQEKEKQLNKALAELDNAKKMIEVQKEVISTQRNFLILSGFSLLLLGAFLYLLFKHSKEKKRGHILLKDKTKKITDSINYAKKIQNSLLPKEIVLKEIFKESFIIFKPKDIVSGDFPFLYRNGNVLYIAAADCTGHGVPGALLSIVGSLLLNEIARYENLSACELNDRLHMHVVRTLQQGEEGSENERDGMDIAMCKIDLITGRLEFSGAHRPLFILRNNSKTEIEEIKGDKFPIGGVQYRGRKSFSSFETVLNKKDRLFIFSDGITDQFGGNTKPPTKLGSKAIRNIIVENGSKPIFETKNSLDTFYINWMGTQKQIDDVLFIGIEF